MRVREVELRERRSERVWGVELRERGSESLGSRVEGEKK